MRDVLFESSNPSPLGDTSLDAGDARLMRSLVEQLAYTPSDGDKVLFNEVASKLATKQYADKARSWQSSSPNIPLSTKEVEEVLGQDCLIHLASATAGDSKVAAAKIGKLLPAIFHEVTVFGELPQNKKDIRYQLESLIRRLPA